MKLSILALTFLIASKTAFAQDSRGAFGDGSPPNIYIAGQHKQILPHKYKIVPNKDYGRGAFGDGSPPNNYIAGQYKYVINEQKALPDNYYGRGAFGDGSVENTYITH